MLIATGLLDAAIQTTRAATEPSRAGAGSPNWSDPYYWWLAVIAALAVLIKPGVVIAYRWIIVPRRRAEIWTSLSATAREAYRLLFAPTTKSSERAVAALFDATHSPMRYLGTGILLLVATAAAVAACILWVDTRLQPSRPLAPSFQSISEPVILAIAGAYVWSLYELLSRAGARDLAPETLSEIVMRYLASVPIGWAFSLLASQSFGSSFAFISAAFPMRELRSLFRDFALKKFETPAATSQPAANQGSVATTLDGISADTARRLQELHFLTALDLAYADPVRIMVRTGKPLRLVLCWLDQALLFVYAPTLKVTLAQWGVPCALDAAEFYEAHFYDPKTEAKLPYKTDDAVLALAKRCNVEPEILGEIFGRAWADPHVCFLKAVWYNDEKRGLSALCATAKPVKNETEPS